MTAKIIKRKSDDKTRVQLELSPKSMERLRWIEEQTEAVSYHEVFRNLLIEKEKRMKDDENT